MAVILTCYTISLTVSSQRAAVDAKRAEVAADKREIVQLQSELRTLARLPELQRWSDQVFDLHAPTAPQFVSNSVMLASYAPGVIHSAPADAPVPTVEPAVVAPATAQVDVPHPARHPELDSGVRQIAYVVPNALRLVPVAQPVPPARSAPSGIDAELIAQVNQGVGYAKVQIGKAR